MKLIISNNKIIATALDNYVSDIYTVVPAPLDYRFDKEYIIADGVITEKPPESLANWLGFNAAMLSNARFNAVYALCASKSLAVANALPTALDQVTTKGLELFAMIWENICVLGEATSTDKQQWGAIAEAMNLPLEFIEILTKP